MSFWNALINFLGIGTSAAENTPPHIDTKGNVESQTKVEEKPAIKVKEKVVEAEYPFVLKPDAALSPLYHQVDRGNQGVLENFLTLPTMQLQ